MYGSDIAETFHRAQRADGRSPRSIATYRKVIRRFGQYQFARDKTLLETTQIYLDISAADLRRSRVCFDGPSTPALAA